MRKNKDSHWRMKQSCQQTRQQIDFFLFVHSFFLNAGNPAGLEVSLMVVPRLSELAGHPISQHLNFTS